MKCNLKSKSLRSYLNISTGGEGGENKQKSHTQNHNVESPSVCHGVFLIALNQTHFEFTADSRFSSVAKFVL